MLDLLITAIVIFIVGVVSTIIYDKRKSPSSSNRDSFSRVNRTSNEAIIKAMNTEHALKLLESRIQKSLSPKKKSRKKPSSKKRKNASN
jgi:hypothetical protein